MAEQRTYQGHVYTRNSPGEPWVLAGPAAPVAGPQAITIGRPDPYKAKADQRDEARLGIAQQAAAADAAVLPYAAPKASAEVRKALADATKAEADAAATAKEMANKPDPGTGRIQKELQADNVIDSINVARRQIGQGWATGNFAGTKSFQGVPFVGQNSTNLAATLSGIQGSVINDTIAQLKALSATGASGYGSLTETEAQRLAASVAALQQSQSQEELKANLARVERHYRNAKALLNNEDPRLPEVAARYGIISGPATVSGEARGELTSEGRMESDPALAGVDQRVAAMIQGGSPAQEIRAYLNTINPGLGDKTQGIEETIQYHNQFPERPLNVEVGKVFVPNDSVTKALGDVGMTGLGAAAIGAADTASGGFLDNMTDNPDLTRAVMGGVSEENPAAYMLGNIAGGASGAIGLEAGAASLGLRGLGAARAADAGYGAIYGAGMADDPNESRLGGAAFGSLFGLGGGAAGRAIGRGVGRSIAGVQTPEQVALHEAGIRMTPGQILGGGTKATEDRLSGLPLVGDQINARRREGVQDFNVAAFDQGLAPVGGTTGGVIGAPGVDIARDVRSQAYRDALDGVQVQADAPFVNDMQGVVQQGNALPEPMRAAMQYTLPTRVGEAFDPNGGLTGNAYQQALRGLRRDVNAHENLPFGYDFAQVARGAEGALEGMVQRQSPGTVEALQAANRANMNVETIRGAVNAARNGTRSHQVDVFMPSQLADAAASSARRFGNNQGTTNQPFYGLTRSAQTVLPGQVPDSGTAGRAVIPMIAASLAGGGSAATTDGDAAAKTASGLGTAAIAAALVAAPYSQGARATIQRALMTPRGAEVVRIGNMIHDRNRIAGLLALQPSVAE